MKMIKWAWNGVKNNFSWVPVIVFLIVPFWKWVENKWETEFRSFNNEWVCNSDSKIIAANSLYDELLATKYDFRTGVRDKDLKKIITLWSEANDCWSEDGGAANALGYFYCSGIFTKQNFKKATKYFSEAFQKGQINSIRYFVDGSEICETNDNHLG